LGDVNTFRGVVIHQDGHFLRVRTPAGLEVVGRNPSDLRTGESVTCLVRPERIRVFDVHGGTGNGCSTTVESVVFQGSLVRATLICGDLRLIVEGLADRFKVRQGEALEVGWSSDDVLIYRDAPN
jgi:putative spermidine/putrescine transport system ATP-binding protein